MFLKQFYRRIAKDLMQKKLIPLKILFFVHASTIFVLYPYLTIHMRELGVSVEETAIMSGVTPVVSIVMPPLAGMLADKIGNFKLLLALSSMLGGASALLLLLVPVGRVVVTFPARAEFALSCPGDALDLAVNQEYPCTPLHPFAYDVELRLETCGYICHTSDSTITNSNYGYLLREAATYQVLDGSEGTSTGPYSLNIEEAPAFYDESRSRVLCNPQFYNRTLRRISNNAFFFPTPDRLRFDCDFPPNNEEVADAETFADTNDTCLFSSEMKPQKDLAMNLLKAKIAPVWTDGIKSGDVKTFAVDSLIDGKVFDNSTITRDDVVDEEEEVSCRNAMAKPVSVAVTLREGEGEKPLSLQGCAPACIASAPRPKVCTETTRQIEFNPTLTFWTYLAVRVFNSIIGGTAFAMFEGAVIAILREQRADYGLQRIYGSVGGIISAPLSGMLIDYASRGKAYTDFRPAFYLYAGLKMASGVLMLSINLTFKQPSQHIVRDVLTVLRNIEMVALFIACFVMGTAWGYIESFLFWLLQDLGASRSLMGVTVAVGGVAGLPLLVMSGPIIRRLGHANVIFIGFVFYAVRLLGYSLIYNPWLCLVFEAMESLTSALAFTAAVTYAARLSTGTTDTSVQGLLGGLYFGVGKGSGSLIGGYLIKAFGTRPTYQIFSAATLTTGCIYFLFNRFYLRTRTEENPIGDDVWKKPPKDVETNKNKKKSDEKALNANVNLYLEALENAPKSDVEATTTNKDGEEPKNRDTHIADVSHVIDKKSGNDSTDGGSDSGVDNPAFVETETDIETQTPSVEQEKLNEPTQKVETDEKRA